MRLFPDQREQRIAQNTPESLTMMEDRRPLRGFLKDEIKSCPEGAINIQQMLMESIRELIYSKKKVTYKV